MCPVRVVPKVVMITEELFRSFVEQAWGGATGVRTENNEAGPQHTQQQHPSHGSVPTSAVSHLITTPFTARACSPLDYPNLLMAYHRASKNALLRYHYDAPILQPRMIYSHPKRPTPASLEHAHSSRPTQSQHQHSQYYHPRHAQRQHRAIPRHPHEATSARPRPSPHTHAHRDAEASLSSASMLLPATASDTLPRTSGYTDLRITPVMLSRASTSWPHEGVEDYMLEKPTVVAEEGIRPSWSPQQVRYRPPTSSTSSNNAHQRISSGMSMEVLNYGGFADEHDEEYDNSNNEGQFNPLDYGQKDVEEPEGRSTVWLDARDATDGFRSSQRYRHSTNARNSHHPHRTETEDFSRTSGALEQSAHWHVHSHRQTVELDSNYEEASRRTYAWRASDGGEIFLATHSTRRSTLLDDRHV